MSAGRCIVCPAGLVAEEGDVLCARCVADALVAYAHRTLCACGPCRVHGAALARAHVHQITALAEVRRAMESAHAPEALDDYLARRDAGATTKDAAVGRGKD